MLTISSHKFAFSRELHVVSGIWLGILLMHLLFQLWQLHVVKPTCLGKAISLTSTKAFFKQVWIQ